MINVIGEGQSYDSFLCGALGQLGRDQDRFWAEYLAELKAANASRLPTIPVGHWTPGGR